MSIEKTLEKVERDIVFGDCGKARERLHGLIATYPNNLALRQKLGDVYWQLQYPAMAGRYWYLEESKSAAMLTACQAFEESCGDSSFQILLALKFQGELESLGSEFAKNRLLALQVQVQDKYGYLIDFQKQGAEKYQGMPKSRSGSRVLTVGCVASVVLGIVLMLIGLITAIDWMF